MVSLGWGGGFDASSRIRGSRDRPQSDAESKAFNGRLVAFCVPLRCRLFDGAEPARFANWRGRKWLNLSFPVFLFKRSALRVFSIQIRVGSVDLRRSLLRKRQIYLVQKQAQVLLGLRLAAHDDFLSVCRWQVYVEHLDGRKFFKYCPRRKPARNAPLSSW